MAANFQLDDNDVRLLTPTAKDAAGDATSFPEGTMFLWTLSDPNVASLDDSTIETPLLVCAAVTNADIPLIVTLYVIVKGISRFLQFTIDIVAH
jgi:hypothetical protein